jgi:hypothetical protein
MMINRCVRECQELVRFCVASCRSHSLLHITNCFCCCCCLLFVVTTCCCYHLAMAHTGCDVLIGCVGKPNAGKSSFLNSCTDANAKVGMSCSSQRLFYNNKRHVCLTSPPTRTTTQATTASLLSSPISEWLRFRYATIHPSIHPSSRLLDSVLMIGCVAD